MMFETEDIDFIRSNIFFNERGIAKIFNRFSTKKIIISNLKKKIGYVWDEDKKIYVDFCVELLYDHCCDLFENIINHMISIETDNKLKSKYEKRLYTITTDNHLKKMFQFVLSKCVDSKIAAKMNVSQNSIPFKNCMLVNLTNGQVRERTSDDLFTYEYDYNYNGYDSQTPNIDKIYMQICSEDEIKFKYLKLVMGCTLTNVTKMKCFFIFYGPAGDNGKSLLFEIHLLFFKNIGCSLSENFIYATHENKVSPTDYGTIVQKNFGVSTEPSYKYINDPIIKKLTGGDAVKAKFLYHDQFDEVPTTKIFILLNNILHIGSNGTDDIMKKRTRVIEFKSEFVDTVDPNNKYQYKKDIDLKNKISTQWADEYFTFCINNAIDFLKSDKQLLQPNELMHEKDNYFSQMDETTEIIEQKYNITNNKNDKARSSYLHLYYKDYCQNNGMKYVKNIFTKYLKNKFGDPIKDSYGIYNYHGIIEKNEADFLDDEI